MNTMTLSSGNRVTSPDDAPSFEPPKRPLPTWLPAPRPLPSVRRSAPAPRKVRLNYRRACSNEFRVERAFMLLLAIAGVAAIGYGFSCLVDLVQHWAVFNAGVGQLVQ